MTDSSSTRVVPGREPIIGYAMAAKTGDQVSVWINGTIVTIKAARDLTIAQNDVLLIVRTGMYWVATQRLGTGAVTPPTDNGQGPDPKPPVVYGATPFGPVETRSYRGSWRTDNDDVYQGQYGGWGNHTGCAFYGSGPRSLAGATVLSASIVVRRKNGGGITAPQATTMCLVTQATRPGGAPTLTSTTAGPTLGWGQSSSAFAVPTAWAQSMVDGTAGGLGFFDADGSPYVIFDGRSAYGPAFTLTIRWQRG